MAMAGSGFVPTKLARENWSPESRKTRQQKKSLHAVSIDDQQGTRSKSAPDFYSHSIVAGGLLEMS
jgi:hypothetical protein